MADAKVSVILPIYNGEKTIKQTIESLLNQTFNRFEIIACIDGSDDASETILESFDEDRIKIIKIRLI